MRLFYLRQILRRPCGNYSTTIIAPLRAQIDNPVGRFNDIHVMFNDHNGITVVP